MPAPAPRISVTMALGSLEEQCATTREALEDYRRAIALRDDLIRDCRAAKVPVRTLINVTGLTRDRINRIAYSPSKTYQ